MILADVHSYDEAARQRVSNTTVWSEDPRSPGHGIFVASTFRILPMCKEGRSIVVVAAYRVCAREFGRQPRRHLQRRFYHS